MPVRARTVERRGDMHPHSCAFLRAPTGSLYLHSKAQRSCRHDHAHLSFQGSRQPHVCSWVSYTCRGNNSQTAGATRSLVLKALHQTSPNNLELQISLDSRLGQNKRYLLGHVCSLLTSLHSPALSFGRTQMHKKPTMRLSPKSWPVTTVWRMHAGHLGGIGLFGKPGKIGIWAESCISSKMRR